MPAVHSETSISLWRAMEGVELSATPSQIN
jgi:hypothetical protein